MTGFRRELMDLQYIIWTTSILLMHYQYLPCHIWRMCYAASAVDPYGTSCSPGLPRGLLPHQRKAQDHLRDMGYGVEPEEGRTGWTCRGMHSFVSESKQANYKDMMLKDLREHDSA